MCHHRRAHWRHLANTTELVLPSAHPSPQPKRQIDQFSRFCTAHGTKSLYFTVGAPFAKSFLFPRGIWTPILHVIPWAHPNPQPKRHLNQFSHFAQMTAECPYTLQWNAPFPLKIALSRGGSGPTCNTWFPGPTRVLNPNSISIDDRFSRFCRAH